MSRLQRTSPLTISAFAAIGLGAGLLLQFVRSSRGSAPFVPPLSLTLTLLVMAGVLIVLGVALRRTVTRESGGRVNPFHAVRLLAGARAGQYVGSLLGGFGGGLALQLLTRSVMPPAATWVPMVLVLGAGIVLLGCGIVAEAMCRVPPGDPGEPGGPGDDGEPTRTDAEPGAA